jgi:hypothetical protein
MQLWATSILLLCAYNMSILTIILVLRGMLCCSYVRILLPKVNSVVSQHCYAPLTVAAAEHARTLTLLAV